MTEEEKSELRTLLRRHVVDYAARGEFITDEAISLDEDNAVWRTSAAELLVFRLPRAQIPALQVAYMAYEILLDLVHPPYFDARTVALIEQTRAIVPPFQCCGHDIAFETHMHAIQPFRWFAREFLDVPPHLADAIYAKHQANTAHLANDDDEA